MKLDLREVAPAVHVLEAPQSFYGLEVGARMTVLELDGGLLVYSPLAVEPASLAHLGEVRWLLAPNLLHHLHVGPWADEGIELWGASGLPEKRKDLHFHGVVADGGLPFGDDVWLLPMSSFSMTNEVVVLHRPSRTLIVTDLVFNFPPSAPWLTRAAMRCLCGYPGCRTTLLERVGMRRDVARRELSLLAEQDFDRVIMAHGEVIESGGREALLGAFDWLKVPATRSLSS